MRASEARCCSSRNGKVASSISSLPPHPVLLSLSLSLSLSIEHKSMEEVWKDISLSNLHHDLPSPPLALYQQNPNSSAFRGLILQDFLADSFSDRHCSPSDIDDHPPTLSLHHAAAPSSLPRKRAVDDQPLAPANAGSGEDRRMKRMIKNRESAARSRARKQAYTQELEMEVAHLAQENAALKSQQQELNMAMTAQALSKSKLQRASSAPF